MPLFMIVTTHLDISRLVQHWHPRALWQLVIQVPVYRSIGLHLSILSIYSYCPPSVTQMVAILLSKYIMTVATLYIRLHPLLVSLILHSWVSANLLHHPQALLLFSTSVRYPMISRKSHSLSILSQPHSPFAYRHRLVIHYMLVYAELGHTMLILYPGLLKKTGIRLLHCLSIILLSLI